MLCVELVAVFWGIRHLLRDSLVLHYRRSVCARPANVHCNNDENRLVEINPNTCSVYIKRVHTHSINHFTTHFSPVCKGFNFTAACPIPRSPSLWKCPTMNKAVQCYDVLHTYPISLILQIAENHIQSSIKLCNVCIINASTDYSIYQLYKAKTFPRQTLHTHTHTDYTHWWE